MKRQKTHWCLLPIKLGARMATLAVFSFSVDKLVRRGILRLKNLLNAHGGHHNNHDFLARVKLFLDLRGKSSVWRHVQVITRLALVVHERKARGGAGIAVIGLNVEHAVGGGLHKRGFHIVSGRSLILKTVARKDVGGNNAHFGVAVLAGLGDRQIDDFAGTVVDANVATFLEGASRHGVGERTVLTALVEIVIVVRHCSNGVEQYSFFLFFRCGVHTCVSPSTASPTAVEEKKG